MPQVASGVVCVLNPANGQWVLSGSCAAVGSRKIWVTAKHCVPDDVPVLVVRGGQGKSGLVAAEVQRHTTVDLAAIRLHHDEDEDLPDGLGQQFYDLPENILFNAGDFMGCAYPEAAEGMVERTFKGHFQRFMSYNPPVGEPYWAGEMSVPAPGGSSGGVLAYTARPRQAAAVITTNHDSYITVDSFEEVQDGGHVYRETVRRVVSYGIALILTPQIQWLEGIMA